MKITAILLLVACLQVSANGFSQSVTLKMDNAPLEKVLSEVERQSGYSFVYTKDVLAKAKPLSVQLSNANIEETLKLCFTNQPFTWKIINKVVVINSRDTQISSPEGNAIPPPIDIKGRVVNEKGEPVVATILVKGTKNATTSNEAGYFEIKGLKGNETLLITGINIEPYELKVNNRADLGSIALTIRFNEGEAVTINTGYQSLPKERSTGSFVTINNSLLNRRVSADLLSRLDGIASGVFFNPPATNDSKTGITIRGVATLNEYVSRDPLIVIDNFPFEGSLNNINPNDIESVTVLRDAAAASIWGAKSGNGVIVITTKKGSLSQQPVISFNTNVTTERKPNFSYDKNYLGSASYVEIEKYLYGQGFYDQYLQNTFQFPSVSPVVEILEQQRLGQLTPAQATAALQGYKEEDLRNQANKYLYRNGLAQQYSLGLSGGSTAMRYYLGLGYDTRSHSLIRNSDDRFTLTSINTFTPVKNLEFTANIRYVHAKESINNLQDWQTISGQRYLPYEKLADDNGQPLAITRGLRQNYLDSVSGLGFLDWRYNPLQEINATDNTQRRNALLLQGGLKYQFDTYLKADILFQHESENIEARNLYNTETYFTRDLINRFSQYDPGTGLIAYPLPLGSILRLGNGKLVSNNFRAGLHYTRSFNTDHVLSAIAGAELRQVKARSYSRLSYGYDDETGAASGMINYNTVYPVNPIGAEFIPAAPAGIEGTTQRFISYYANLGYTYKQRYTVTLSGRKDGANIFGVRTNDRITPLWSAGLKWNIAKENFFRLDWLSQLAARLTYGYNGNVYGGSAYLTARLDGFDYTTNLPYGTITTAPNPDLRWEKIRNINFGIDFSTRSQKIMGSVDLFSKKGEDLIEQIVVAPSSGFSFYSGNAAETRITGIDIMLQTVNIRKGKFSWTTNWLLSTVNDKVLSYETKATGQQLLAAGAGGLPYEGRAIRGIYSFRWAGLNPQTGDPQGYIGKEISQDYNAIVLNASMDSLVYHGSVTPRAFGSLRNTFTFGKLSLSANIIFKFNYYFRRNSTGLNYQELYNVNRFHQDYDRRWQAPGDEAHTSVPSLVYLTDVNRDDFYRYSEILVEKGDHIRLQDIQLAYDIPVEKMKRWKPSSLSVYLYINNLGLIWKANKAGIDPDRILRGSLAAPRTISFGIKTTF